MATGHDWPGRQAACVGGLERVCAKTGIFKRGRTLLNYPVKCRRGKISEIYVEKDRRCFSVRSTPSLRLKYGPGQALGLTAGHMEAPFRIQKISQLGTLAYLGAILSPLSVLRAPIMTDQDSKPRVYLPNSATGPLAGLAVAANYCHKHPWSS